MKPIDLTLKVGDRVLVKTALDPWSPERKGVLTGLQSYGNVTVRLDGERMDRATYRALCTKEVTK